MGYTKLFDDLIMSTIWRESDKTRILWITMLALRNKWHTVNASVPGLADAARIPLKDCREGLKILLSPDVDSRTTEFDGRRIKKIDGGWLILNGEKYRQKMSEDERRDYKRIKQKEYRERDKKAVDNVKTNPSTVDTVRVRDKERVEDQDRLCIRDDEKKGSRLKIPYQEIVDLYHEILPELPTCRKLTAVRKSYIKGRWLHDGMGSLAEWNGFFGEIRPSQFLMGKSEPQFGRPPFIATLEWMTKPANFNKICEGMYHRDKT